MLSTSTVPHQIIPVIRPSPRAACAQLQAAVSLAVTLEVVLSCEGLMAERALEGPRSAVQGQVVFEVVGVEKSSRAVWARVRAFTCVFPHVDFQFVISDEEREEIRCKKGKT